MTPAENKARNERFTAKLFTAIRDAGDNGLSRRDIVARNIEGYQLAFVDAKLSNFVVHKGLLKRDGQHNYFLTKKGEAMLANGHDIQGEHGAAGEAPAAAEETTMPVPPRLRPGRQKPKKKKAGSRGGFSQKEREANASELRSMVLVILGNASLPRKELWKQVKAKLPHVTLSAFNNLIDRGTKPQSGLLKRHGKGMISKGEAMKTGRALVAGIGNVQRGQQMRDTIKGIIGSTNGALQAREILQKLHEDGTKITASNLSAYLKNMAIERTLVKTPTGWATLNTSHEGPEVISQVEITFNIRRGNQRLNDVTQREAFQIVTELSGFLRFAGH